MDLIASIGIASKRPMTLVLIGGAPPDISLVKEEA